MFKTVRYTSLTHPTRSAIALIHWRTVRSDGEIGKDQLAGTRQPDNLVLTSIKAITTWRTIMSLQAQDKIATILLKNGGSLWIIRTNQV